MSDHVEVGVEDRILTIRLNRPEKKKALTSRSTENKNSSASYRSGTSTVAR